MKEYIRKQLDDQVGRIVNEYAEGNLEAVERRFGAVENFVMVDEKEFLHGIRDDEKVLKKEMDKIKETFIKGIETALEHKEMDEQVMHAFQAYETIQGAEQALMGKYGHDLVESLVTYQRALDNNKYVATEHKSYDTPAEGKLTDDMNKFLNEKK